MSGKAPASFSFKGNRVLLGKKFELNCLHSKDMDVSTAAVAGVADGIADSVDESWNSVDELSPLNGLCPHGTQSRCFHFLL